MNANLRLLWVGVIIVAGRVLLHPLHQRALARFFLSGFRKVCVAFSTVTRSAC
jgi:hypothetical protein